MTTQPEYKTTTNGMIDYAHYTKRAHDIRSQDAWNAIGAIGAALRTLFRKGTGEQDRRVSAAPLRRAMRPPEPRSTQAGQQTVNTTASKT